MSDVATAPGAIGQSRVEGSGLRLPRLTRRNVITGICLLVLAAIALIAVLAPAIAPYDPTEQNILRRMARPNAEHWLGTDVFGRDVLSRLIWAAQPTLIVAAATTVLAGTIGGFVGIASGYRRGKLDDVVGQVVDTLMAFPTLLLALLLQTGLGSGLGNVILASTLALLPRFVRVARGSTLAVTQLGYVEAARCIGARDRRIIVRHLFPNIWPLLRTVAVLWVALVIRIEASVSFLGLGVQPPMASWGLMVREGFDSILINPLLALWPGLLIVVLVLALTLVSEQGEA